MLPTSHSCRILQKWCSTEKYFSRSMKIWQLSKYGEIKDLTLSSTAIEPIISRSSDVLVKVNASSVNPLDVAMIGGFGRTLFNGLRKFQCSFSKTAAPEFPLTLGRDYSGVVVQTGKSVKNFKPGDEVWGVVPFHLPGSHAEYLITSNDSVIDHKPKLLTDVQAASIPYVCITALASLVTISGLKSSNLENKRILILGGSGGIGTFAIQWLKAKGAYVATTASTSAVDFVANLGADTIIDYKDSNFQRDLYDLEPFDVVLNAASHTAEVSENMKPLLKSFGKYVTLTSPFLKNMDDNGMALGVLKSISKISLENIKSLSNGYNFRWAFAIMNPQFLKDVTKMVENKEIVPVIDRVFSFDDVPEAFEHVAKGHSRGKTVIDMNINVKTETNSQ